MLSKNVCARRLASGPHRQQGGTLAGLLVGVVLGMAVAAGTAYVVYQQELPFISARPTGKPVGSELPMVPETPAPAVPVQGNALPDPNKGGTRQQVLPQLDRQGGLPSNPVSTVDVTPEEAAAQATAPAAAGSSGYQLQAGSFRRANEAEALKLRLALQGLEARVESARVNGQVVFRVRVGPYASLDEANQVRRALSQEQIDAALIRPR